MSLIPSFTKLGLMPESLLFIISSLGVSDWLPFQTLFPTFFSKLSLIGYLFYTQPNTIELEGHDTFLSYHEDTL